jgi:hypothetical protein
MAHSFLIFDFGGNEEAAQQARHRIEGWKQGFRLDKKIQVKFERTEPDGKEHAAASSEPKKGKTTAKGKGKAGARSKSLAAETDSDSKSATPDPSHIRLIVRLDFSDHEKLSHQRWIDRIPTEEPFKDASPRILRVGEDDFTKISDLFDSLN